MPRRSRRQTPSLKRRKGGREPKRKFVLFCEGQSTEPDYFKSLRVQVRGALIEIEIVPGAGVPYTIAKAASKEAKNRGLAKGSRKKLDSYEKQDEVWAVFDRDQHPNYTNAVQKCMASGVGVARSNPCFEVSLILHFCDYHKPDDRHGVQCLLKQLCDDYDPKGRKTTNCDLLIESLELAENRAVGQLSQRKEEGSAYGAPSTTVFQLTRSIREAAKIRNDSSAD